MNELSVDELIELSTQAQPEVFAALSEITATAASGGIEATVNLEGRLVALTLEPSALAAPPARVAAEIFRLVQEASATALNSGIEVLAPTAGDELAAELRALVLPANPAPTSASAPASVPVLAPSAAPASASALADDFSTVETWAVPR